MGMEEITTFGIKYSLSLPSLANKNSNSLRDGKDEAIYTCTGPFMRNFVRKSVKGGRYNAFNQHFKSEISDEVFNNISKELNVNSNICNLLAFFLIFETNMKNYMQKCSIQNMRFIEILLKKKKLIIITKNLTC